MIEPEDIDQAIKEIRKSEDRRCSLCCGTQVYGGHTCPRCKGSGKRRVAA